MENYWIIRPAARKGPPFAKKVRLFGFAVLGIAAVELAVAGLVFDKVSGFVQGLLVNFGTDTVGVAVTVLVINALQERAQEEQFKQQLIRDMGSRIRDLAVRAAEEMAARGWLYDGSLTSAILTGTELSGTRLDLDFISSPT